MLPIVMPLRETEPNCGSGRSSHSAVRMLGGGRYMYNVGRKTKERGRKA